MLMRTLLVFALVLLAPPAVAHPHIFIDAEARIAFNDAGEIISIRNVWTFDEAFSAWQTQGLDTNADGITSSEEMQELADDNLTGLAEYGFYTSVGEANATLPMVATNGATFVYDKGRSTLTFSIRPEDPYRIKDALEIAISDPEYYVAINFTDVSDVTLENGPEGCQLRFEPPKEVSEEILAELYALSPDVTRLPPRLAAAVRGSQGAIIVTCPPLADAAAPATAVKAATGVEQGSATPFGGPPTEPGQVLPRTGLLGWLADRQREFYQAATAALGALRDDNNAFWMLGSLSFLYGVFHAAGPGHGKVVISSYMLANERQVRRGVVLSFLSAMLQAGVAIGLVLVAAAAFSLTAAFMNETANWIGVLSYGLIALLGLWLIGRKLFERRGSGSDMDHGPDAHHHAEHDHHHHVVPPEATRGSWREQVATVLAVGLRPCSGALVVLAFALSEDVVLAGIVAVLLMALGTALTVALLAGAAVWLKGMAAGVSGGGAVAARVLWWAELSGAVLVFGFGTMLLLASF
jgi:ABC-type nickel/cobalt efflux system permease component RcnA/ABC-type uncharacterized transport system substrate-binding protein